MGGVIETFFEDVGEGFFGREIEVVAGALDLLDESGGVLFLADGDETAGDEDAEGFEGGEEQTVGEVLAEPGVVEAQGGVAEVLEHVEIARGVVAAQ